MTSRCNCNVIVVHFFNRPLDHSRVFVWVREERKGMATVRSDYLKGKRDEIVGERKKQVKETRSLMAKERFSAALAA